ncbi:MAG TPA: DUF983 domain-containing protein [Caulobacteraceae bacterium]|jgi:uncharacterized protein (DUF983 family)|nr:DUF983 domain-containing protein [Caulobacteraceae bacterium]
MSDWSKRSAPTSMLRGLRGKCPHCGKAKLFYRYLKVEPVCQTCGHDLDRYPADDGPAYFTVLLVGHLVIVPFLILGAPLILTTPIWILMPAALVSVGAITLTALPVIKGGVVGLTYALDITRADARLHTADAAE